MLARMDGRLREIAAKNADLSDQGRSGPAGTPKTAANGQGAGGEYKRAPVHVKRPAPPAKTSFMKGGG